MKAAKAVVAAVGTVATAVSAMLADNVFDFNEVGTLVTVVLVAGASVWGVYEARNREN